MANYAGLKVIVDWDDSKVRKGATELQKLVSGLGGGGAQGVSAQISPMKALVAENNKLRDSYQSLIAQGISPASQKAREAAEAFSQTNSRVKEIRAQTKGAEDAYARLSRITNEATRHAQNLGVQYGVTSERFIVAAKRAEQLTGSLKQIDQATGRNFRNVGNYAGSFNAISVNMSRIVGEMPNFAQNMRIGFMALSNNIQPLAESISELRRKNIELAASGQPTVSALKAVGTAFFGWQTLLMVGVTALTVYGPKLVEFIRGTDEAAEAQKRLNDQKKKDEEIQTSVNNSLGGALAALRANVSVLESNTASQAAKNRALNQLQDIYPSYLGNLNMDMVKNGQLANILNSQLIPALRAAAKARAAQDMMADRERQNISLYLKQSSVLNEISRTQGKVNAAQKEYNEAVAAGATLNQQSYYLQNVLSAERANGSAKKTFDSLSSSISQNNRELTALERTFIFTSNAAGALDTSLQDTRGGAASAGKAVNTAGAATSAYAEAVKELSLQLDRLKIEKEGGFLTDFEYEEEKLKTLSAAYKKFFVDLRQSKDNPFMQGLFGDMMSTQGIVDAEKARRAANAEIQKLAADQSAARRKEVEENVRANEQAYNQILKKAEDYYQQRENLENTYQRQLNGLEANRGNLTAQEYQRQLRLITNEYKKAVDKITFDSAPILQMLNQDLGRATTEQLTTMLMALEQVVETRKMLDGDNRLIDVPDETLKQLKDAYDRLKQFREEVIKLKVETSDIGKLALGFGEVGKALQQIGDGLSSNGFDGDIIGNIGNMVVSLSQAFLKINAAVKGFKEVYEATSSTTSALKSLGQSKDWIAAIIQIINVVVSMFGAFNRYNQELDKAISRLNEFNSATELSSTKIAENLRAENLERAKGLALTNQRLEVTKRELELNKSQAKSEADRLMQLIQGERFISNKYVEGRTWFAKLFGGKPKEKTEYSSLAEMNYDQINKLFLENRLEGRALELFNQLQKLKQEGIDIDKMLIDLQIEANEIFTGTTADNITNAIIEGFANGKRSIEDFADDFESLMKKAALESLKVNFLQKPIQDFYNTFAGMAGKDGGLTEADIASLRTSWQNMITESGKQVGYLEEITKLSFGELKSGSKNNLSGAITQASQESIDLLAGHTMGARVAQLETNRHLTEMKAMQATGLDFAQQTARNTGATVIELKTAVAELKGINGKLDDSSKARLIGG